MNIVGLDLSLTATGVCDTEGRLHTIVNDDARKPMGERLTLIRRELGELVANAEIFVVEGVFVGQNNNTLKLGKVHGVVEQLAWTWSIPIAFVSPFTLKKFATGKTSSDKSAMAVAAWRLAQVQGNDNEIDAWWLRFAGQVHYGDTMVDWPAAQVEAINGFDKKTNQPKVEWPAIGGA